MHDGCNVKDYLKDEGYDVESMNLNGRSINNLSGYDAIVVTGLNTNFLGTDDTDTKAVVINADGLTPLKLPTGWMSSQHIDNMPLRSCGVKNNDDAVYMSLLIGSRQALLLWP